MSDVHYLFAAAVNYVVLHQDELITFLLSGTGVSVALQLIKHFGKLQDAKKLVMVLLAVLSAFASLADQLFAFTGSNSGLLALHNLGWVITIAVFSHRFAVSPVYYKIVNFLNGVYADAQAYRAEKAQLAGAPVAAAAPAASAPVAPEHEFTIPQ